MNDIDSPNNKKESNFKVYKDKLNSFMPKFGTKTQKEQSEKQSSSQNKTEQKINLQPPIPDQTISPQKETLSVGEIREKIRSQSINNSTTKNNTNPITPNTIPPKDTSIPKNQKISGSFTKTIIKVIIITLVAIIIGYVLVNYRAMSLRFNYWYETNIENKDWAETHPITLHQAQNTAQKLDENYLYIPMISIQAPINWGISEDDVSSMLSSGLVQYKASALPDDPSGNIYIIGNTSGPIWSSSDYKTVFTLLDKAQTDHVITVIYKNNIYSYRIFSIEYLSNSDILIEPGSEDQSILNLIAQYPIGINYKTLRIRAELFKIESNIVESIQDKVKSLDDVYDASQTELAPIEVQPTSTAIPTPNNNNLSNPDILPQHFLPDL